METINLTAPMVHLAVERPVSELKTESQSYVDQLPVAEIIHQKPKQRDWHPPDGFILGLWTLILLVFFKTYGVKHLKHIF
ncbi:GPI-anchor transamidase-like [Salvelinus namaycush]|uniref:GPI-anchor transamidase-like n=2 Tax=Salvelinus TaxID=8033 RepID=A0A8U0QA19_SALNM|nr:GPI-anchor transamidase-like [Salvelinus namaycush]